MSYETKYVKGAHNFICDICGFQWKSTFKKITWDGFVVCPFDYDFKHPNLEIPKHPSHEGMAKPDSTGDDGDEYRTLNDVTASSTELMQGGN